MCRSMIYDTPINGSVINFTYSIKESKLH